ncbi:MAG: serine/threonine protein phosphatase, partial [Treponema sp.]|nr:serine/threonine protein phosphatase [Treponema sp.]
MKSLKTRFFLLFIGLSAAAALGVGVVMYLQYLNYIKATYQDTLKRVTVMIEKQYPVLADPAYIEQEATILSEEFWTLCQEFNSIAASFDMAYLYYVRRVDGKYQFLLSSEITPDDLSDLLYPLYGIEDMGIEADIAYDTQTMQITPPIRTDAWGGKALLSGYLPIVKNGVTVGLVGADYDVSFVKALESRALFAFCLSFVIVILAAGIIASVVSSSLIKPIKEV